MSEEAGKRPPFEAEAQWLRYPWTCRATRVGPTRHGSEAPDQERERQEGTGRKGHGIG